MRYRAFISYRHGDIDEEVAVQVHREIEKYRIPGRIAKQSGERRLGRVFRDADELRAASDLSAVIRSALDESEWLIVIATPRYRESRWCLEEIEYFLQLRGRERILVILAEGEPQDSFPTQLTEEIRDGQRVEIEPLAVDVRASSTREMIKKVRQERFRLFAPMLEVSYDDLRQRQRERRMRRIAVLTVTAFIILGGVLGVITVKNIQLNRAYDALDQSNQETLRGESYYLAEYADEAYRNGDSMTALMLALQALPKDLVQPERPLVTQVVRSLTQALGVYDYVDGYKPGAFFEREGETYDIRTQVSEDGSRIRIESYTYTAGNILGREVKVCSLPDGRELCRYTLSPISRTVDHAEGAGSWLSKDGKKLIYLGGDGIHFVRIDDGEEEYFVSDPADELKVGSSGQTIVTIHYEDHRLCSYDGQGEKQIDCNLGEELNYVLGEISPGETKVALATNTEEMSGVVTIDLKTGDTPLISMPGLCTCVKFIDENRLCFLLKDETDGLKHIVQYDLEKADQGYLCNADWDMRTMTLTSRETCLYHHENKVYEVDCNSKRGKKLWEKVFSSSVISVAEGEGIIAVSCMDGSVSFFDGASKNRIDTQAGNGEPFTVMTVDGRTATLRDYWGKELRVYRRADHDGESAFSMAGGKPLTEIPDAWYTCGSLEGKGFMLGFRNDATDQLAVFSETNSMENETSLNELGLSSFDNVSLELRDYLWVQDYDSDRVLHFDRKTMQLRMEISDDDYYYYSEDGETVFVTEKESGTNRLKMYRAASGEEEAESVDIGKDDRGMSIGGYLVTGDKESIRIRKADSNPDSKDVVEIPDAVLYGGNLARGLVFYRSVDEKHWTVYDVKENRVVCEGDSGAYTNTVFFGGNRYLLNDYRVVYDMDTWKPVLDLSELGNSVFGVMTTNSLPYFVVWCQESETGESERDTGFGTAYLYEKEGDGEIIGVIPGFVSMTPEGKILVYDGAYDLYEVSVLSTGELVKMAEHTLGDRQLTEAQRKRYHLFEGQDD